MEKIIFQKYEKRHVTHVEKENQDIIVQNNLYDKNTTDITVAIISTCNIGNR